MTEKSVVSARDDGIGSRMFAFLNARWLATELGRPFAFHWPEFVSDDAFQGVPAAEQVFESEFLEAFHRGAGAFPDHHPVLSPALERTRLESVLAGHAGLKVEVCTETLSLDGAGPAPGELLRVWNGTPFLPRLREVIAEARGRVPPDAVGIHIRRGDIVHGPQRILTFRSKMQPLALFKHSLSRFAAAGVPIVVFSDDAMTLSILRGWPLVTLGADLAAPLALSKFERAIFDLAALSACRRIVGARSTFAMLAAMIGDAPLAPAAGDVTPHMRLSLVLDDHRKNPDHYDDLARAKELQWLALSRDVEIDDERRDAFLAEAAALDPGNQLHIHLRAAGRLDQRRFDAAEALLAEAANEAFDRLDRTAPRLYFAAGPTLWAMGSAFARVSPSEAEGRPFIQSFQSALAADQDQPVDTLAVAARATALAPDSDLLLARHTGLLIEAGRLDEAQRLLSSAISAGRQPPVFHWQRAGIAEAQGNWTIALGHARALIRKRPGDPAYRVLLALCLARTGDLVGASERLAGITGTDVRSISAERLEQARALVAATPNPAAPGPAH